jgi:hypothetical protein
VLFLLACREKVVTVTRHADAQKMASTKMSLCWGLVGKSTRRFYVSSVPKNVDSGSYSAKSLKCPLNNMKQGPK